MDVSSILNFAYESCYDNTRSIREAVETQVYNARPLFLTAKRTGDIVEYPISFPFRYLEESGPVMIDVGDKEKFIVSMYKERHYRKNYATLKPNLDILMHMYNTRFTEINICGTACYGGRGFLFTENFEPLLMFTSVDSISENKRLKLNLYVNTKILSKADKLSKSIKSLINHILIN